uniref:Pleckstrin homology domain containing, family A member 5 n=1 Tax=Mastacembelus armatus TaxID=205130 RepID=A0A7N8X8C7_9TELE
MAADPQPDWLSCLPSSWGYGVTRDGRIFFINEEAKSTTWLHPVTREAVITGHRKTPDLPTGWEEGYTFEGARCFINHNERKVTCKHPVSGVPSQDNCIFVVNEHSSDKKERPTSTMSEASNYTGGSDYSTFPGSPATTLSRSSKKVHNFGKRSNSIKRNLNAPVVKSNWLYKQDSTGMKLWKKRWFVLSDMCLFYYRDEKEDAILGSILLPSFHISMLSVDDHISRKYAFKATHPNMRTYYFCTDTAKEMESWMKVMTDAALVHMEPVRRLVDQRMPQELNNLLNHRVLTRPEIQNNERNLKKYSTLREGDKYATLRDAEKYATVRDGDKYGFQRDLSAERSLTKISSIKLQPAQAAAIAAAVSASRQGQASLKVQKPAQVNGSGSGEQTGDCSTAEADGSLTMGPEKSPAPVQEPEKGLSRSNSMQQLEHWVRTYRTRGVDDDTRSIMSYQTLPRNMPSHRAQIVPRYPEGYRTLPRNSMMRPDSICSIAGSVYDRALRPASTSAVTAVEKRRSMRDDTMWQLYEWQQRQAFSRQSLAHHYGTLPSTKTMGNISEHTVTHSIPTSPSHGSLALYNTFSPPHQQVTHNPSSSQSELSSPVFRGDVTLDRRHRTHLAKYGYPPDRRSIAAGITPQPISPQSLQGKTISPDDYKDGSFIQRTEEVDIDTKLSRLCEQDKAVRMLAEKVQQLHREKHTLETALLSASQELSEQSSSNTTAMQSLVQQRDVLQNGLLSTCRELSRVNTELERSWREYDRLEADVTLAKSNLLEQLEALGSPQTEPPSQQHIQIQKELWRIQDVMEALSKNTPQRSTESSFPGSKPLSSLQKNEQAPDYRLYKSEPELTTVKEEVDEANGEDKDKTETSSENKDSTASKVPPYPVGIIPPRTKSPLSPPESSTIASYVTLRKTKKTESKSDRPRSAVDQTGFGEREVGRPRMSVEEQLERMRRNQEASSLREKKRETPSRSPSFSKDNPFLILQVMSHLTHIYTQVLQSMEQVRKSEEMQPAKTNNLENEVLERRAAWPQWTYRLARIQSLPIIVSFS